MTGNCICGGSAFAVTGKAPCVKNMAAIAGFVVFPRFNDSGVRNSFDLTSATLGQDLLNMIQVVSSPVSDFRIYPLPAVENVQPSRTDTVYDTAPSTQKYKVPGVGNVYTFAAEIWDQGAVNAILREMEEMGCSDTDFITVDVTGLVWLRKDTPNATIGYGWKMNTNTWDAFRMFASDTTVEKISFSFDLARFEKVSEGYYLDQAILGYEGTDLLNGLLHAFQTPTPLTATTTRVVVFDGFGSATDPGHVVGLLAANFKLYNQTTSTLVTPSAVSETAPGDYTLTHTAQTAGNDMVSRVTATGYDVEESDMYEAL